MGCIMDDGTVWITGLGAVTPVGCDFETIAARLLAGQSAAEFFTDQTGGAEFRAPSCRSVAWEKPAGWSPSDFAVLPRIDQAVLCACSSALDDSAVVNGAARPRIGLVLGLGAEWLRQWETGAREGKTNLYEGGEADSLVQRTREWLAITGPAVTISAACASANYAMALARQWLRLGLVDACLAGGAETLTAIGRSAFHNLRALSRRSDDATQASRPFDRDRDGFVMGEGCVMLLLESANHARNRSAQVYAEVAGYGATSDSYHMIIPSSDSNSVTAAIQQALADAHVERHEVDYVNAHATGTPVGDVAEARALHRVFGPHVMSTPVSSTKSVTGHMLSAAAAMEAVAGIVAIQRQAIPPTINLDNPDPECDLCHVRHEAIETRVNVVVSNSLGFGGNNSSLVLRKVV
jgi:3-oxoacyl-[acyl-carrier-protein] synthase II